MLNEEDLIKSPQNVENAAQKSREVVQNDTNGERKDALLFSPRFRSVAAMAGWDEEALMIASLIVEDTPDRHYKQKKRPDNLHFFKTPPTNSRRKRRAQRRSPPPASMPVAILDLEEEDAAHVEVEPETKKEITESKIIQSENECDAQGQGSIASSSTSAIPCMDRLREELSCAICLDICFEPSTTPCGHSFCKKCLRSAADKCGKKCPKCRQLIGNGRSCTVNTVLWNTIQLIFPQEVEARKAATGALNNRQVEQQSPVRLNQRNNVRNRNVQELRRAESRNGSPSRRSHHHSSSSSSRRQSIRPSRMLRRRNNELPSQDEDAALAMRLQREEFMGAVRGSSDQEYTTSLAIARANLRAMASRAVRGL